MAPIPDPHLQYFYWLLYSKQEFIYIRIFVCELTHLIIGMPANGLGLPYCRLLNTNCRLLHHLQRRSTYTIWGVYPHVSLTNDF